MANVPAYALSVSDFPTVRAEGFEDHVVPTDTKLETRARQPVGHLVWSRQAQNMGRAFALAYGLEHEGPIERFRTYLVGLYEQDDHQFPFTWIADVWEEMFWRQCDEMRQNVANLVKTLGKETVRKEEFIAAALVPNAEGRASLRIPNVWDFEDPEGYFRGTILPRLELKAQRAIWDSAHKAGLKNKKQGEE